MQAHAEIGYRITSQVHSLAHVSEIIRQHHEWMGGGYPLKLKGEQILLPERGGLWFANSATGVGASPLALELAAAMEPPGN